MDSEDIKINIDGNLDTVQAASTFAIDEAFGEIIPLLSGDSEESEDDLLISRLFFSDSHELVPAPPGIELSSQEILTLPHLSDGEDDNSSNVEESCSIPRVPHRLRQVNPKAYEPNVISYGPYHYGKKHLKKMEDVKRSCFAKYVETSKHNELKEAMNNLKDRVLECYDRPIHQHLEKDSKAFIGMMIHDGCFIVQVIRLGYPSDVMKLGRQQDDILWDMLLLENQLPFFLLDKLDEIITEKSTRAETDFFTKALTFFETISDKWSGRKRTCHLSTLHLLDMVHKCCCPSSQGIKQHEQYLEKIQGQNHKENLENIKRKGKNAVGKCCPSSISHVLDLVQCKCGRPSPQGIEQHEDYSIAEGSQRSWQFIRSATELDDAGIFFSGKNVLQYRDQGLFDIEFAKRPFRFKILNIEIKIPMLLMHKEVLEIPTLQVDDTTERVLRNLLAYEQFNLERSYVYDYMTFMDNLINTGKDVQLLRTSGVIDNWLGDDETVAQMFNKLGERLCASENFYYAEIFDKVNKHCNGEWNKAKAKLRKDYFASPWSYCSFFAALVLLVLTVLQTAYTLISYYHPK